MIRFILIVSIFCIIHASGTAQTRTIQGAIIDENLELIPGAKIYSSDSLILGETDYLGRFEIEASKNDNNLIVGWPGMEWCNIEISDNCEKLEIIMMYDVIYDFMAMRRVDRLRKKRFSKLPHIRTQAYKRGLFMDREACYSQDFISYRE